MSEALRKVRSVISEAQRDLLDALDETERSEKPSAGALGVADDRLRDAMKKIARAREDLVTAARAVN